MNDIHIATRRDFLQQGLGLIGIGVALPNFLIRTALAGEPAGPGERILVVLQLSGGHDGLSAVVPYGDDNYGRNRTATRIAANEVLKIDDQVGLHPNLKGCRELLDQGAFAVVQGVGYPNPNRSHFKSMDIWHLGDNPPLSSSYGWIGRYCETAYRSALDPRLAIAIGTDRAPRALQGKTYTGISLQRPETYRYFGAGAERLAAAHSRLDELASAAAKQDSNLAFVAKTAVAANQTSEAILRLSRAYTTSVTYPQNPLSASLRTVAALIAGGLSTRVYYVFQGGFDTHAGQRARHDRLMTELSEALTAFQKDLTRQNNARRVLTMAFSEFGRRVRENGSQGTDHGTAGPMFLIGPGVKPGLHGRHPSLAEPDLDRGDLRFAIDFRSLYATVLETWLSTSSQAVLGRQYPRVDCLA